jgi:urease alpha subunit
MTRQMSRCLMAIAVGLLVGLAPLTAVAAPQADAEPVLTDPTAPATTSTTDELADMVMEAIDDSAPAAPTSTPLPVPPG